MKTLEQIDYLKKQLGIRDNQVLEEIINSYTNAQASLQNQLVKQQQRIDKAIELIENDYFEDGSFENYKEVMRLLRGEDNVKD